MDQFRDLLEAWQGGIRYYNESQREAVKDALVKFQQKKDTKAATSVITGYSGQVRTVMTA